MPDRHSATVAMFVPARPQIYHIVHVDRLASILQQRGLHCDATSAEQTLAGSMIGLASIKARRLTELVLHSHPGLYVGQCVPFYFCPRSVMLYLIHMANHAELAYRGGQTPIIHLQADLRAAVAWAQRYNRRWAFTLSNAGSRYFEDRCDLACLHEIQWDAVNSRNWAGCREGKQAEFLLERAFPWRLVERIGVHSRLIGQRVAATIQDASGAPHRPVIEVRPDWYY